MRNQRSEREPQESGSPCDGCTVSGRRTFLLQSAGLVAAAMAELALSPGRALALPIQPGGPSAWDGDELVLPVPPQDGATIYREHGLILARSAGAVFAFSQACPHQKAALRWLGDQGRFQCSKHKSKYRPDGVYISGRATRSMDRFPLRLQDDRVRIDLSRPLREDRDREAWLGAVAWLDRK